MTDLRDMFVIARREFLERVRSRWFVVMTLIGPIGMVAIVLVPALIAGRSAEGAKVEIVDRTGAIAQPLADGLALLKWKPAIVEPQAPGPGNDPDAVAAAQVQVEMDRIRDGKINGFVTVPRNALEVGKDAPILYLGDNGSSQVVQIQLRQLVGAIVQQARGKRAGIAKDQLDAMLAPVRFDAQRTNGKDQATSGFGSFLIGYFLAFILYMVITLYGVGVMRSVVQEKTSRVMELMVATVKPRSLMTGKIIGVGSAGLVQVVVWLAMGAATLAYREQLLAVFGVTGGGPGLPPLALDEIVLVIAYFVVGFFFYASMYAAAGAMVSSEQDTQQAQMPVTMVMLIGILCVQMVSNDPRGSAAQIMTMVPFWSSMLMPMRYLLGGASLGEVAISLGILVVSTVLIARAAAKIYRVGVLMYGKRPGLGELVRWLRY